jgi:hypothetical protein
VVFHILGQVQVRARRLVQHVSDTVHLRAARRVAQEEQQHVLVRMDSQVAWHHREGRRV